MSLFIPKKMLESLNADRRSGVSERLGDIREYKHVMTKYAVQMFFIVNDL